METCLYILPILPILPPGGQKATAFAYGLQRSGAKAQKKRPG